MAERLTTFADSAAISVSSTFVLLVSGAALRSDRSARVLSKTLSCELNCLAAGSESEDIMR
ncbi:hypothetical protein D3C75_1188290 [compost metagenome]